MRVRKAVFPAAGWGTRFLPATKAQPKEMLPLVDKPIIQYAIEEAVAAGIKEIIIVTAGGKRAIEDHFDNSFELEYALEKKGLTQLLAEVRAISDLAAISYVRQKEQLGLGHAIWVARALVGQEPFAVFLSDDIIDAPVPCMAQMLAVFERFAPACVVAVERVPREDIPNYGIIKARPLGPRIYQVEDLVEKPSAEEAPSNLGIVGRYILAPEIFDCLEGTPPGKSGEIQLTDGLRSLLASQPVYAYEFDGLRYDAGHKLGFLRATVEFALKRPDLAADFRRYLRSLDLGME